jgi:hypothetical protein
LNFDNSPTLRNERIPAIGNLLSWYFSGNAARFPLSVQCGVSPRASLCGRVQKPAIEPNVRRIDSLVLSTAFGHELWGPGAYFFQG